ncbi:hypothetical protein CAPTEDRAFT_223194 [Capitella teleta]|uniref:Little elongation complex subunit 2 C-terminal domain-containing protein n=1 Tax=Capitella teleta TaxID=283909 RepID=R7T3U4_CAPTE|nr:hypothetical protein CAPTEDRAFT_223194 [Capitella teleta]|eukprot:ELT87497.1 hypothetical protein CAPTEDRAFT_223194 [Capitella teleta]
MEDEWLTSGEFDKYSIQPSFRELLVQKQKELDAFEEAQSATPLEAAAPFEVAADPAADPVVADEDEEMDEEIAPSPEKPAETSLRKESSIGKIWSTIAERKVPEECSPNLVKKGIINTKSRAIAIRVPFPRPSFLSTKENSEYLRLLSKFLHCNPSQLKPDQQKDFSRFKDLHKMVLAEQAEFLVYLERVALQSSDDYNFMHPQAHAYLIARLSKLHSQVKCYPRYYMMLDSVSLVPPKIPCDIPFVHIKTLLELGEIVRVLLPKKKMEMKGIFLSTDANKIKARFPVGKDDPMNPPCSQDSNVTALVEKYLPHIVISASALKCIIDNQPPHYHRQWEIPVHVRSVPFTENGMTKEHKVIVVDKPLVPRVMSVRDRNQRFHKTAAKIFYQHPQHGSMQLSPSVTETSKTEDIEPDLDPSDFETFGMDVAKPTTVKLPVIDEIVSDEEKLNLDGCTANDTKSHHDDTLSTSIDTDDERLVIDADDVPTQRRVTRSQSEGKTKEPDIVMKRRMSSASTAASERKKMKDERSSDESRELRSRKVSVPLEQATKKSSASTPTIAPSSSQTPVVKKKAEPLPQKIYTQTEKSNNEQAEWEMCEDPKKYAVPPTGHNVTYNLWQLGDFRLLIRCKYHGHTKTHKNQKPFFVGVSSKMEYQPQYGVEQLTFSEACRDWVTCAIRKNCHLIRARVNAFTSELLMTDLIRPDQIFQSRIPFNPMIGLNVLHAFLGKLYQLNSGHYLITHTDGNLQAQIKKVTQSTVGVYDLHERNAISVPSSSNIPWIPVDPNIMIKFHKKHNRIPATFEPKDSKLQHTQQSSQQQKKWKKKIKKRNKKK